MKGSPLGIGTDIGKCHSAMIEEVLLRYILGGSIRVPAAFCGIYGLKPSVGRLPHGGLAGTHAGMENIIGAVGPMARYAEDLSLFCKVCYIYLTPPIKANDSIVDVVRCGTLAGRTASCRVALERGSDSPTTTSNWRNEE